MNHEHSASPSQANSVQSTDDLAEAPQWRPLDSIQRRVVGVLIEKSKTTKDSYPLTLNAITTACNQKSNRKPQMELESDDVEATLDELREMNAVVEIQGSGRTTKYKHTMYQWMGVSKVEIAVMGELLLRGEQSLGDLRARAARMEPIAGLSELKPIVEALVERKLVVELTPAGRGQMVTHGLYSEREMNEIRNQSFAAPTAGSENARTTVNSESSAAPRVSVSDLAEKVDSMQKQIDELKQRLDQMES